MTDSSLTTNNSMVNLYNSRLKEVRLDEKIENTREKLKQWRLECHQTIDNLYQQKLEELNFSFEQFREKHEEKMNQIQTNILQLNSQENLELQKSMFETIEEDLNEIEHTTLKIQLRSLTMDNNYIQIEREFPFPNFKDTSETSFVYSSDSSSAIASSERFLLMHQHPNLNLIDPDSKISKQIHWPNGWIRDMCWSEELHSFILLTSNHIYFVNEKLELDSPVNADTTHTWFSCTCSKDFLYISTCQWGSSIFQFSLTPSVNLIKQWQPPLTCAEYDGINDIKCNGKTLAVMINDPKENKKRMELKSIETFSIIWSFHLLDGHNIRLFTCCPINFNEWLVIDGRTSQISKDGKLKMSVTYPSVPYRANLFGLNTLAISAETDLCLRTISV